MSHAAIAEPVAEAQSTALVVIPAIMAAISEVHSGNAAEALAIAEAVVTAVAKGDVPAMHIHY